MCYLKYDSLLSPRSPKGGGVYCFTSVRPSKIFFVAFFSVTVDGRNLIFGHKRHIVRSVFGPIRFLLPVCRLCWFLYTLNIQMYMFIFRCIFLSNYWWQKSDIWSQASYRYPISWEACLDPSDSYFLFTDLVGFYTHWTYTYTFFVTFFSATIDGRDLILSVFGPIRFLLPVCRRAGVS